MKHMAHRNYRLNLKWKTSAFNEIRFSSSGNKKSNLSCGTMLTSHERDHRMAPDGDWILNHLEIRNQIYSSRFSVNSGIR